MTTIHIHIKHAVINVTKEDLVIDWFDDTQHATGDYPPKWWFSPADRLLQWYHGDDDEQDPEWQEEIEWEGEEEDEWDRNYQLTASVAKKIGLDRDESTKQKLRKRRIVGPKEVPVNYHFWAKKTFVEFGTPLDKPNTEATDQQGAGNVGKQQMKTTPEYKQHWVTKWKEAGEPPISQFASENGLVYHNFYSWTKNEKYNPKSDTTMQQSSGEGTP